MAHFLCECWWMKVFWNKVKCEFEVDIQGRSVIDWIYWFADIHDKDKLARLMVGFVGKTGISWLMGNQAGVLKFVQQGMISGYHK